MYLVRWTDGRTGDDYLVCTYSLETVMKIYSLVNKELGFLKDTPFVSKISCVNARGSFYDPRDCHLLGIYDDHDIVLGQKLLNS